MAIIKFEKTHYVSRDKLEAITRYLTDEPESASDCLDENEKYIETVSFGNGIEMNIECCGVRYRPGESNLAWTQAVLYDVTADQVASQIACSDPEATFLGDWDLPDGHGNVYIVHIEQAVDNNPIDTIHFDDGRHMYSCLVSGIDLYSRRFNMYVFAYNDAGALCYYRTPVHEVQNILKAVAGHDDAHWSEHLGPGGYILDDLTNESYDYVHDRIGEKFGLYLKPSLDFCDKMHTLVDDWVMTTDVTLDWLNSWLNA